MENNQERQCSTCRHYKGNCENLHGHNWKVEATLKSDNLDRLGMVEDFRELKKHMRAIMEELDHKYINELEYFKAVNPTSENIAFYIFKRLKSIYGDRAEKVVVWENDDSSAEYSE